MSRRILIAVLWGLAGLAIAGGLIAGAFALAGEEIARPATPIPAPSLQASRQPGSNDATRSTEPSRSATASPSDDASPGSGDEGGADDHGGSSGSDDNSGPGSSNSGSGSDDSGSGSEDNGDD